MRAAGPRFARQLYGNPENHHVTAFRTNGVGLGPPAFRPDSARAVVRGPPAAAVAPVWADEAPKRNSAYARWLRDEVHLWATTVNEERPILRARRDRVVDRYESFLAGRTRPAFDSVPAFAESLAVAGAVFLAFPKLGLLEAGAVLTPVVTRLLRRRLVKPESNVNALRLALNRYLNVDVPGETPIPTIERAMLSEIREADTGPRRERRAGLDRVRAALGRAHQARVAVPTDDELYARALLWHAEREGHYIVGSPWVERRTGKFYRSETRLGHPFLVDGGDIARALNELDVKIPVQLLGPATENRTGQWSEASRAALAQKLMHTR